MGFTAILGQGIPSLKFSHMDFTTMPGQGIPSLGVTACPGLDMSSLDFCCHPRAGDLRQQWSKFISASTHWMM